MKLAGEQLVLDTNILLHLLRGKRAAMGLEQTYAISGRNPRAIISVVSKGELKALAYKFNWSAEQHERVDLMLDGLPAADVSHRSVWSKYAELDHASAARGVTMGKNDLWIAATVIVVGGVLLTTDGDFDHLAGELRLERVPEAELR